MLKSLAKAYELKESIISKKSLRLTLILMIMSLPMWPTMMLAHYDMLPSNGVGGFAFIAMIISFFSLMGFAFSRFVNRFFFADKYLDEWEITIKRKSMTFTFQVSILAVLSVFLVSQVYNDFTLNFDLSGEALGMWMMGPLLSLLYIQTFHALWQVRPMDEE